MFPLLAARFFNKDEDESPPTTTERQNLLGNRPTRLMPLKTLDLASLPRENGPPTELRNKKEKLAFFDVQCTHVGSGLYVGGEKVAKALDILQKSQISHIINCVGYLYQSFFPDSFEYMTLYLQDSPKEDIVCVLYDVFDFIESALEQNGKVCIHCSQGVSRSCAFAIAYRMWMEDRTYDSVFEEVKKMRGVANPNIGFICQLFQWYKRRHEDKSVPRLYRIASQSSAAPNYLVPKSSSLLDPRGSFVLHDDNTVWVWLGASCICDNAFIKAANRFASQLLKYENPDAVVVSVKQGEEPKNFWRAYEDSLKAWKTQGDTCASHSPETFEKDIVNVAAYDKDYDTYRNYIIPPSNILDGNLDSARSGRKTPRFESSRALSPNDRLRKQARSEIRDAENTDFVQRGSCSSVSSGSLGFETARSKSVEFGDQNLFSSSIIGSRETPRGENMARRPSRFAVPKLALGGVAGVLKAEDADAKNVSSTKSSTENSDFLDSDDSSDLSESTIDDSTPRSDDSSSDTSDDLVEEMDNTMPSKSLTIPVAVPRLSLGTKETVINVDEESSLQDE